MVTATWVFPLPEGSVAGENQQAHLAGRLRHARVRGRAIPGAGVKVICCMAEQPAVALTEACVRARVNPGFNTVTVAVAWSAAPSESATVTVLNPGFNT